MDTYTVHGYVMEKPGIDVVVEISGKEKVLPHYIVNVVNAPLVAALRALVTTMEPRARDKWGSAGSSTSMRDTMCHVVQMADSTRDVVNQLKDTVVDLSRRQDNQAKAAQEINNEMDRYSKDLSSQLTSLREKMNSASAGQEASSASVTELREMNKRVSTQLIEAKDLVKTLRSQQLQLTDWVSMLDFGSETWSATTRMRWRPWRTKHCDWSVPWKRTREQHPLLTALRLQDTSQASFWAKSTVYSLQAWADLLGVSMGAVDDCRCFICSMGSWMIFISWQFGMAPVTPNPDVLVAATFLTNHRGGVMLCRYLFATWFCCK